MHARVGESILQLWRASGARSLFVAGTAKNVGKTVALRAVYRACTATGSFPGIASIGRDGEAVDAVDAIAKPRLWLEPQTVIATARDVLPASPASELLALSSITTAAGVLVFARVRCGAHYELIGPPNASAVRAVVDRLVDYAGIAIVDGAVDRVAALAGGDDAIVVACGAAGAATIGEIVDDVRALVVRLQTPRYDGRGEALAIEGALTPARVAQLIHAREQRAIVVRDPTQIVLRGKAVLHAFERLRIRCERPLRVIAATVASIGGDRSFSPRALAEGVARATGLPTFDVYAAERAA
ncbi:MAG TPA: hypothetical protein VMF11_12650 [Candidatus Baltobacteraceae bacterium]|nr:hypothetical protein [Candidatus Baltobacteraceae bacterium]